MVPHLWVEQQSWIRGLRLYKVAKSCPTSYPIDSCFKLLGLPGAGCQAPGWLAGCVHMDPGTAVSWCLLQACHIWLIWLGGLCHKRLQGIFPQNQVAALFGQIEVQPRITTDVRDRTRGRRHHKKTISTPNQHLGPVGSLLLVCRQMWLTALYPDDAHSQFPFFRLQSANKRHHTWVKSRIRWWQRSFGRFFTVAVHILNSAAQHTNSLYLQMWHHLRGSKQTLQW